MVFRIFVEKKPELAAEAAGLLAEAKNLLGISGLENVRLLNRYDAEGLSRELFDYSVGTVFSEPQVDLTYPEFADESAAAVFAVEFLPGQFDQRADSAAQCIQIISQGERPEIRSAKVYALYGSLSAEDIAAVKKHVINPVEAREASLALPDTLAVQYDIPTEVQTLEGFTSMDEAALAEFVADYGLAMDKDDLAFCQQYFASEKREPTITEIRMIDTYWSDHCRHTTFNTVIDSVKFADPLLEETYQDYLDTRKALGRTKPICLMDMGTLAAKYLKKTGQLDKLDESEEINACTVKMTVTVDGKDEPWLLLFKNETHNHPTEIEPFGGAATCIGGAIRDPLSGRSYVYAAMRVTGAADPLVPVSETIPGKLPQRRLVTTAAAGYSSYGNQIGLTTGLVDEIYHPGYAAKRMEVGGVIAAAPAENVRREVPAPGDVVILLGGRTGRDGIGGATGSSKSHNVHSVETCGAEVQKGNAPEERKLQRLFRNPEASRMIKRCNDFGAGGVSVAIGELADGLEIDLNKVPKKYEGLDGTELAISESQERMAVVVEAKDLDRFLEMADAENLEATKVAVVKEEPRLTMFWNGKKIVDVARAFLDTNGTSKHIDIETAPIDWSKEEEQGGFAETYLKVMSSLKNCSRRGLSERFDSTIGAGTVLMPFGGRFQRTPIQAMVHKIPLEKGMTDNCSFMSYGFNPYISEKSPYHGAYLAVVESVSKLIACGASFEDVYLSFQEYFAHPGKDGKRWGQPLSAVLGAFKAQMELGVAAIGGKDSMSGTFEKLDVPPTLISFAVTTGKTSDVVSPELKQAGDKLVLFETKTDKNGLPETASLKANYAAVTALVRACKIKALYTPVQGGIADAAFKMAVGNGLGVSFADGLTVPELFAYRPGCFLAEVAEVPDGARLIADITDRFCFTLGGESISGEKLSAGYEGKLESVFPCNIPAMKTAVPTLTAPAGEPKSALVKTAKPRVLIPVFPGTNCEYDSARAVERAGGEAEILIIRNLTSSAIASSVEQFAKSLANSQMIFIPGGFSGGDEPDGSGKFITAFFRNAAVKEGVTTLLEQRDGLMAGICNGFQALIKLGLVPYGKIIDTDASCPTLSFNTIGRHQSKIVRTRIVSNKSPFLALTKPGEIYSAPISHGEGRFLADEALIRDLIANGQVATQYVDLDGNASGEVQFNPNGSLYAIEGITSPDGRVFGKMGHAERWDKDTYKNVAGNFDNRMFEAAMNYFK